MLFSAEKKIKTKETLIYIKITTSEHLGDQIILYCVTNSDHCEDHVQLLC